MTDASIVTITAAFLIFGGQVVTMIQNIFLGKKSDDLVKKSDAIHNLADGTLTAIRAELSAAMSKVSDLERLVGVLADRKGDTGRTGRTGETGKTGETGEAGEPGKDSYHTNRES